MPDRGGKLSSELEAMELPSQQATALGRQTLAVQRRKTTKIFADQTALVGGGAELYRQEFLRKMMREQLRLAR